MDAQFLMIVTATSLPIIFVLYWWEYKTSACSYGGSDKGIDNWLTRRLAALTNRWRIAREKRLARDICDI